MGVSGRVFRRLAAIGFLALCAHSEVASAQSSMLAGTDQSRSCSLSASDRSWLDRAVAAWSYTARNITRIKLPPRFDARIFDSRCLLSSSSALAGGPNSWTATPHAGQIRLPNNEVIHAQVTSFASSDGRNGFFVMSTPSVWRAGHVDGGAIGLEATMVAVLLHEGSHVAQIPTYGNRMESLSKRHHLPESFNDDSIQERFAGNAEFARSVDRETSLLLTAAGSATSAEALKLARQARALMLERQQRWFAGPDAYLAEAEDIWLTMEGSAQWAGYRWLIDPHGGQVNTVVATAAFGGRGKWWSQKEGFALFLLLDRLTEGKWKRHAFGDGALTGLEMLDQAIGVSAARPDSESTK